MKYKLRRPSALPALGLVLALALILAIYVNRNIFTQCGLLLASETGISSLLGLLIALIGTAGLIIYVQQQRIAQLQTVLDHLPCGVTLFDSELKLAVANHSLGSLLGLPAALFAWGTPSMEELARFNAERGEYGDGDPGTLTEEILQRAREPRPHRFERTRPNGTVLDIHGVPLPGGGFVTIYTDITARKEVENTLERQAHYLRSIVEHLPQAISVFDDQLRLQCWNKVLLDVLELPPQAVYVGVPFEDLIMIPARRGEYGPGDPAEQVHARRELALKFQPHRFERTRPNGRTHLVDGRPMLVSGRVIGFVSSYTDITERKQWEENLKAKNTLLQTLVDNIPGGVTVFDANLRLALYNAEVLQMLDFPPAVAATNPSFEQVMRCNAERGEYGDIDIEAVVAEKVALAREPRKHRVVRERPNGTVIEVRGAPIPGGGFVTIYTDITEQRQMEDALRRQSAYLRAVLDQLPQGVSVFDETLHLKHWNHKLVEVLELPEAIVFENARFDDLIRIPATRGEYGDDDIDVLVAQRRELALRFQPHRVERTRPNGRTHLVEGNPMHQDGRIVGFITTYTDITDHTAIENELRKKNQVLQTLIDNIPGGVTLFDGALRLIAYNAEYQRLLDFPDALFAGEPNIESFFRFNAARGEYGPADAEAKVRELMTRAKLRQSHLFERTRPNGTVLEIRGLPLPDGGFVTIYTDISEHKEAAAAIERLAHRDPLTGLANRYTLEARLDQSVADARRHGTRLALMFIDMDHFKSINDSLGHAVGDEFLIEVAQRLLSCVRSTDTVGRLGGDEFVIVVADVEDTSLVGSLASKIMTSLAQPIMVGRHELAPSASVGICIFPDDGDDRIVLMKNADIAMYHAKSAGRGQYQFFDDGMTESANERLQLEADLRRGIDQGELVLHYQPQYDAANQRIIGFEALVRWARGGGSLVPPDRFIPLAEDTGLIGKIGTWVLRTACETMQTWRSEGFADVSIAVNLSARQLKSPQFPSLVANILSETGLPPRLLELEITETVAMEDPQVTIENLQALKRLGVGLSIDDFGTGYSSLAYLKLLPISRLKLDKTFVKDIENDVNDAAICAATISLAHNLGLNVVAEGVETNAQCSFLQRLHCDFMQGYYFSRPVPAPQARLLLSPEADQHTDTVLFYDL